LGSRAHATGLHTAQSGPQLLAEVLLRDLERIAERGAARMQELLPAYARVPRDELIPVVVTNTRDLLEAILDPEADPDRAQADYEASGESRARQGITSDEMLNAWRIGLEVVREEADRIADELDIGKDELLEFVVATLHWGDVGMRASASAHHEAEIRELGRLAREQAALRRVATTVARGRPSEEVLAKVAEEVGMLLGVEAAGINRYEQDGSATVVASWGLIANAYPLGTRIKPDRDSVTGLVYRTERPGRVDDYEHASGSSVAYAREAGARSAVGSPIVVNGRLWGAIVAATSRQSPLPADAEWWIAEFTELVATAISNIQARSDVERLADEQAALRRVATMVAHERPPGEIFAKVAEEVGLVLGADIAVIHRYEPDRSATVVGSWGKAGDAFPVGQRSTLDGQSATALVYRTGRPARLDSYEHAAGALGVDARKLGLCSGVASPIVVNGRLWGAMAAGTSRAAPMALGAESRIAEFTELVATAISNIQARSDLAASRARVVAAADEERRRVVRDLHDGAQQRLVHTVLTLKLARRALEGGEQDASALLDEAIRQSESATNELRELAHGILPSVLIHGGLRAAVRSLASRMSIPVDIHISIDRLPRAVEATAYFVVAEALTNVAKHAQADSATVTARLDSGTLQVEVCDDGVGGAQAGGSGFVGLSDRLAVLNGTLHLESPVDGGTWVAASIPVR
jgi:signal transduction histidine kinase